MEIKLGKDLFWLVRNKDDLRLRQQAYKQVLCWV